MEINLDDLQFRLMQSLANFVRIRGVSRAASEMTMALEASFAEDLAKQVDALMNPRLTRRVLIRFTELLEVFAIAGAVPSPDGHEMWTIAKEVCVRHAPTPLTAALEQRLRSPETAPSLPAEMTGEAWSWLLRFAELENAAAEISQRRYPSEVLGLSSSDVLEEVFHDPVAVVGEAVSAPEDGEELRTAARNIFDHLEVALSFGQLTHDMSAAQNVLAVRVLQSAMWVRCEDLLAPHSKRAHELGLAVGAMLRWTVDGKRVFSDDAASSIAYELSRLCDGDRAKPLFKAAGLLSRTQEFGNWIHPEAKLEIGRDRRPLGHAVFAVNKGRSDQIVSLHVHDSGNAEWHGSKVDATVGRSRVEGGEK